MMEAQTLPGSVSVRGQMRPNADIASNTWFGVGGRAQFLFKPEDTEDLAIFLRKKPNGFPVTVIGVGSNLLIRDGGVDGVVVRLGRGFTEMQNTGGRLKVGAAALDVHVAEFAARHGMGGLEFLCGIPGTIGGAVAMNGGAYGSDMSKVLESADVVTAEGELVTLANADLGFSYRCSRLPAGAIVVSATLKGTAEHPAEVRLRMENIRDEREATQPIRNKTGGSTFKNPPDKKAWELIDAAGCRGLTIGGAKVSEHHCNFLINTGTATAADIEALGEEVQRRVKEKTGVELEWEIKRIGKA